VLHLPPPAQALEGRMPVAEREPGALSCWLYGVRPLLPPSLPLLQTEERRVSSRKFT